MMTEVGGKLKAGLLVASVALFGVLAFSARTADIVKIKGEACEKFVPGQSKSSIRVRVTDKASYKAVSQVENLADVRSRMLEHDFNVIVYNLVDVVENNCRIKQALIKDKRYPNLYLLPSAQTKDKSSVSPEQMKKLTEDLREDYDFVLLDCPAGIEQGFQNAIAGADRALVVTTPEVSAIRDADRIVGLLEASEFRQIDLIINRLRYDMVKRGEMMSSQDVVDILALNLIGIVPDDENVVIATNQGEPVVGEESPAGKGYENICRRLTGEEIPVTDFSRHSGIRKKLSGLFHRR